MQEGDQGLGSCLQVLLVIAWWADCMQLLCRLGWGLACVCFPVLLYPVTFDALLSGPAWIGSSAAVYSTAASIAVCLHCTGSGAVTCSVSACRVGWQGRAAVRQCIWSAWCMHVGLCGGVGAACGAA